MHCVYVMNSLWYDSEEYICLFICLFVWGLSCQLRIENFSLIWRRHQCRWRAENFDPWHSHLLPSVWQLNSHYLFYDLDLSRLGLTHPTLRLRAERSNSLCHRRGEKFIKINIYPLKSIFSFFLGKYDSPWTFIFTFSLSCNKCI